MQGQRQRLLWLKQLLTGEEENGTLRRDLRGVPLAHVDLGLPQMTPHTLGSAGCQSASTEASKGSAPAPPTPGLFSHITSLVSSNPIITGSP